MSSLVDYWMRSFILCMLIYCFVYLVKAPLVGELPVAIVILATLLTFVKASIHGNVRVPRVVYREFLFALFLLGVFIVKQVVQIGMDGLSLAIKIALYHLVFVAGLLAARYEIPKVKYRSELYAMLLFLLPLAFFIIVARDAPKSDVLSLFNRNSFASYILISSTMLLGLVTQRPVLTFRKYLVVVAVALIINATLGGLLAFTVSILVFLLIRDGGSVLTILKKVAVSLPFFIVLIGVVLLIGNALHIEAFERLSFVYTNFYNLVTKYTGSWLDLNMGTAVSYAEGDELHMSAMFRILHSINIFSILSQGGVSALLLGGGTDWIERSESLFVYSLAAHNDYVRIIAEQGLMLGTIYTVAIFAAAFSLRRQVVFIPILSFVIFFGTENLLNNFSTTSLFMFLFGYAVARNKLTSYSINGRAGLG